VLNKNNVIWKDVKGYENSYEVSNTGIVKSKDRFVRHSANPDMLHPRKGIIISARITTRSPYLYVKLYQHNVMSSKAVHRLVAYAFCKNPDKKNIVNHLDGDKLNNNACNLEWCTYSENSKHAFDIGLRDRKNCVKIMLGTKYGKSSKYHNVTYDKTRNKWKATLKVDKKMVLYKRFDTEEEAALCVNKTLDSLGLHNRPRNIIF
jgi:hypothetical protein